MLDFSHPDHSLSLSLFWSKQKIRRFWIRSVSNDNRFEFIFRRLEKIDRKKLDAIRFRKCCFPINCRGRDRQRATKKREKNGNILFPSMSQAIDRALLSILPKKNLIGGKKAWNRFDTWRGLIARFGKYFALNRWPGTTPHAPFQRFLPALPRYLARGNDESSDFRRVEYFCSAIRSALADYRAWAWRLPAIRGR